MLPFARMLFISHNCFALINKMYLYYFFFLFVDLLLKNKISDTTIPITEIRARTRNQVPLDTSKRIYHQIKEYDCFQYSGFKTA